MGAGQVLGQHYCSYVVFSENAHKLAIIGMRSFGTQKKIVENMEGRYECLQKGTGGWRIEGAEYPS